MFYTAIFFTIITIIFYVIDCMKPKNYPPGPPWFPILGSALAVIKERNKSQMMLTAVKNIAQQYNSPDILGLKIGKDKVVIMMSDRASREMFLNESFDGRPTGPFFEDRTFGERMGVLLTDQDLWHHQRRFVVKHLKDFGFARRGMTEVVENESEWMLNDIRKCFGGNSSIEMSMHTIGEIYTLNTIWRLISSKRYDQESKDLIELQAMMRRLLEGVNMSGSIFSHFPILRFIAPASSGYNEYVEVHKQFYSFIRKELGIHKRNFKKENQPLDLIDVYLWEMAMESDPQKIDHMEKQLMAVCLDMFLAGSETTQKSLSFMMLYLVRTPLVQQRCQEEIDRVIGKERLPKLEDRPNMPYCEAAVQEGLRFFLASSFAVPHRALRDTELCGYTIPKDSMILATFHDRMGSERFWGSDCAEFRPERFLRDGKICVPPNFYPFGLGKHRCMGETLARSNLFTMSVTLLQNFSFGIPEGHPLPSVVPIDGTTPSIQPYFSKVTIRNK